MQPGPQRFAAMMLTVICANNDTINAYVFLNMMLFTKENTIFSRRFKARYYTARELLKEFHFRHWSCSSLD